MWDARAGAQQRQYAHHGASVVDADWRNNTMFASCSQVGARCCWPWPPAAGGLRARCCARCSRKVPLPLPPTTHPIAHPPAHCSSLQDGSIAVCKLSDPKPLRHWQGAHSGDINR